MNTKICVVCLEEKSLDRFEKKPSNRDGRRNNCYRCRNKMKRKSPSYRKYRAKMTRVRYQKNPAYREKVLKRLAENKRRFPFKQRAREYVKKAIKAGRLVRLPCPCGNPRSHGHHEDYSKPLEVTWLCASCHMRLHVPPLKDPMDDPAFN